MKQRTIRSNLHAVVGVAALALAVPAMAQDTGSPDEGDGEPIQITPDMVPDSRPVLPNAPRSDTPSVPPPDGSPAIVPDDRKTSGPPSVLVILAHPDDELTIAPVLARIQREGGQVTLVYATSGDAGPGLSGLEPGEELAALREDEARCAAFGLGLEEPIFWRFGDGTLADTARNADPVARDLGERIAQLIEIERPRMIMTWGPDGGYGHADHRMISNAVTQVVQAMGEDRPDLLYPAFSSGGDGEGATPPPGFEGWALTHPSLITDRIRYQIFDLDAMQVAAGCYVSQFDETARAVLTDTLHDRVWRGTILFRQAFPDAR